MNQSPEPTATLARLDAEADTRRTFQAAEVESIRLAAMGRLIAVVLFTAYGVFAFGGGLQANTLLYGTAFGVLALALYLVAGSRFDRPWIIYGLAVLEIALLADAVLTPNPFNPSPWPQPMVYRYDNFYYFFVLIAVSVFTYRPALVMWTGAACALAWGAGLVWILGADGAEPFAEGVGGMTSAEVLARYVDPNVVLVSGRIKEMLSALLVAGLLAAVVWRGRRTVERLIEANRDRQRLEDLFGRYVPVDVARAIREDRGLLRPEERVATVLFADLERFASIVEEMEPAEVLEMLNEYFGAATEVIGRRQGVVTQFQGDAILAIFNVPLDDPEHARHAVDAALEIARLVEERRFRGRRLAVRVGVDTGQVVAGSVGGGGRMTYTVHGDAVNVAARLEQMNKEAGTRVLVSEATMALIEPPAPAGLARIGSLPVRGRRRTVEVYAPVDALAERSA